MGFYGASPGTKTSGLLEGRPTFLSLPPISIGILKLTIYSQEPVVTLYDSTPWVYEWIPYLWPTIYR